MLRFALTSIFMKAVARECAFAGRRTLAPRPLFCALPFKGGAARRRRGRRIQQLSGLRIDRERVVEEFVRVLVTHDTRQLGCGITPNLKSIYRSAMSSARVSLSCGSFSTVAVSAAGSPRTYRRTSTEIGNTSSTCRPRKRASASGLRDVKPMS